MQEVRAKGISIEPMSEKYRRLVLATGWESWVPGQFVMVRVPDGSVLIRRPFGIVEVESGKLEICFKVTGPGTDALSQVASGDHIDVLGPLGHGFDVHAGSHHVLVAGGYGIAPLVGLAKKLSEESEPVSLFYGAKSEDHLLYRAELDALDGDVVFVTEDGSVGQKGLVTDAVKEKLAKAKKSAVYACGPEPLMQALAKLGRKKKVPVQVSMDQYMACGIGVCLGCICENKDGTHVRACREGPVFNAEELKWQT